jgi:microcystin-dependent protein
MNKTTTLIKNRYTLAEEYVGIEDTFVPARGVTIIYPVENGYQKVKLGDGVTTLADLPWCGTPGVGGDIELIKVVNSLPETGEENKIYLVPISGFPTAEPGVYEHGSNFTKLVYSLNEPIDVDGHTYYYYSEEYSEAEFAFGGDIILPDNIVESIALSYSGDIVIPASVTSLELSCLSKTGNGTAILGDATECKLTTLYSKATTPPSWIGNGTPYLTKIVVPKGCAEAYKSANVWKNFADIIVEAAEGSEQNLFDEWIWINKGTENAPEYVWEWITTKPSAEDLSGTVSVAKGGTGATTLKTNAIIAGNGSSAVKTVSTANGALYATASNGAAQFGTLPIAQGGTGATTAAAAVSKLKSALVDLLYPVGSIYMSASSTSPSTLFGGTWEAWGQGRVPVGVATSGTFATAGATGGTEANTLTVANLPSHKHTGSSNSTGSHTHTAQSAGAHSHSAGSADAGSHYHEYSDVKLSNTNITLGNVTARIHPFGQGNGVTDTTDYAGVHSHTISVYEGGAHTHTTDSQGAHSHTITIGSTGSGTSFSNLQPYVVCYMWKRTA